MIKISLSLLLLLSLYMTPATAGELFAVAVEEPELEVPAALVAFEECGLLGEMEADVFTAGFNSIAQHKANAKILAIADMSQPSNAKRLYIIDLEARKLLLRTYVAHGQKTGDLVAKHFSNENNSHKSSLGLYRVGEQITSPKHGAALLLYGLDKGSNCQALAREVIMHGADYVSEEFIRKNGRLGRSWGCPAVSRADMPLMIQYLANGGLLYVHA